MKKILLFCLFSASAIFYTYPCKAQVTVPLVEPVSTYTPLYFPDDNNTDDPRASALQKERAKDPELYYWQ